MKVKDKYTIAFHGLSNGKHSFEFSVTDSFFESFEESEIKKADIVVLVELQKRNTGLTLNFDMNGKIDLLCDRCLEYFDYPISYKTQLLVDFGEENSNLYDVDTLITLSTRETEIHLETHLFDYINLCIPTQRIHPLDENGNVTCNQEMLDKIEEYLYPEEEESDAIDPRWEQLKNLKK